MNPPHFETDPRPSSDFECLLPLPSLSPPPHQIHLSPTPFTPIPLLPAFEVTEIPVEAKYYRPSAPHRRKARNNGELSPATDHKNAMLTPGGNILLTPPITPYEGVGAFQAGLDANVLLSSNVPETGTTVVVVERGGSSTTQSSDPGFLVTLSQSPVITPRTPSAIEDVDDLGRQLHPVHLVGGTALGFHPTSHTDEVFSLDAVSFWATSHPGTRSSSPATRGDGGASLVASGNQTDASPTTEGFNLPLPPRPPRNPGRPYSTRQVGALVVPAPPQPVASPILRQDLSLPEAEYDPHDRRWIPDDDDDDEARPMFDSPEHIDGYTSSSSDSTGFLQFSRVNSYPPPPPTYFHQEILDQVFSAISANGRHTAAVDHDVTELRKEMAGWMDYFKVRVDALEERCDELEGELRDAKERSKRERKPHPDAPFEHLGHVLPPAARELGNFPVHTSRERFDELAERLGNDLLLQGDTDEEMQAQRFLVPVLGEYRCTEEQERDGVAVLAVYSKDLIFDDVEFQTVQEGLDFMRQIIRAITKLHFKKVAHGRIEIQRVAVYGSAPAGRRYALHLPFENLAEYVEARGRDIADLGTLLQMHVVNADQLTAHRCLKLFDDIVARHPELHSQPRRQLVERPSIQLRITVPIAAKEDEETKGTHLGTGVEAEMDETMLSALVVDDALVEDGPPETAARFVESFELSKSDAFSDDQSGRKTPEARFLPKLKDVMRNVGQFFKPDWSHVPRTKLERHSTKANYRRHWLPGSSRREHEARVTVAPVVEEFPVENLGGHIHLSEGVRRFR